MDVDIERDSFGTGRSDRSKRLHRYHRIWLIGTFRKYAQGLRLDFVIYNDRVPIMDKVYEMIDAGMVPEGHITI